MNLPFHIHTTTLTALLSAVLFLMTGPGCIQAEILPRDDLSKEWVTAKKALKSGEDRFQIASRLQDTAARNPASWWYERSLTLAGNFETSAEKLARLRASGWTEDKAPWSWLAESKIQAVFLRQPEGKPWLKDFIMKYPDDPVVEIIAQGRKMIPLLIPHINDMSPSRSQDFLITLDSYVPRVSDTALHLVEYLSGCSFCEDNVGVFSTLAESTRIHAQNAAQHWWETSGHFSKEEGIRAHMPHAGARGRITMCSILITSANEDDRLFAQAELHQLAEFNNLMYIEEVGQTLESQGDSFCRGVISRHLKDIVSERKNSFITPSSAIFHLIRYGGRADWEVLTQCAQAQVGAKNVGGQPLILPAILASCSSSEAPASMYAIPSLALALETRFFIPNLNHLNEAAIQADLWKAMLHLQKLTGEPFGVTTEMPAPAEAERVLAHIEKWWRAEGQAKYTFDLIQQRAGQ